MRRLRLPIVAAATSALLACTPAVLRAPSYHVDKSSPDWIVVFHTNGVIRLHLRCDSGEESYISTEVHRGRPFHIKPGQWVEWVATKFMTAVVAPIPNLRNC